MHSKNSQKGKQRLRGVAIGSVALGAGILGYQLCSDKGGDDARTALDAQQTYEKVESNFEGARQKFTESKPIVAAGSDNMVDKHPAGCGCGAHGKRSVAHAVGEQKAAPIVFTKELREKILENGKGDRVVITLPGGGTAEGVVEVALEANGRRYAISGSISAPQEGKFYFQEERMPGLAGDFSGAVHFTEGDVAYSVDPGADGTPKLKQKHIDQVICRSYAPKFSPELVDPAAEAEQPEQIAADHPTDVFIPDYQNGVIPLESLPSATAVAYLDFDGEEGPHLSWGNFDAAHSGRSNTQIKEVWVRVAEDFAPFNINVTTDLAVYQAAPANSRIQCIVTPTTTASPGAGGVAYVGDFNRTLDRPCWAFYTSGKNAAEVISHEIGHTMGLSHDGRSTPSEGYYGGHGSGDVGWASIMGVGYYRNLSQWSKGEYLNANQTQDDLSIISNNNNNVGYRADDHGATLAAASNLEISSDNSVANEGVIETDSDEDGFKFTVTASSTISLTVSPVASGPNLDILAELVDSGGSVVSSNNPDTGISATISTSVAAGEYFLRVSGVGRGDVLADGYSDYASLGEYSVTGSVTNAVVPDRFSIAENSANTTSVGTVTPNNNHGTNPLSYAITSGNSGGAFSISSSGEITVADAAQLDYENLSTYYDDPATFDLSVSITDTVDSGLNETVRVVVTVTDVNEAPTISAGGTHTVLEHTQVGVVVTTVVGSDVDHYDGTSYAITAGNTGNAFAIDADSGEISFATDTDATVLSAYNLTVEATDQGTPGLSASTTVTINLVDIPAGYTPGSLVQAYYHNINGSAISDLTSAPNFPASPDVLFVRNVVGSTDYGDNYGSTMRGYIIPPTTGTYTFWLAMGDSGRLQLSTDADPANATVLHDIGVSHWANYTQWDKYPEQQSSTVVLQAGQPYYFELLHKESSSGDWVSLGWQGPSLSQQLLSGLYVAPYDENFAPELTGASIEVETTLANGSTIGTISGTDLNSNDTVGSFTILSGNTNGAFAIDAASGVITVANNAVLSDGDIFSLVIQASDDGTPVLSNTAVVTINVIDYLIRTHFEDSDGFTGYVSPNTATLTSTVDARGNSWSTPDDALIWKRSDIPPLGDQCLTLDVRSGTTITAEVSIPGSTHGVGTVSFDYASISAGTSVDLTVWYRVDGGAWMLASSTDVQGLTPNWESKPWPFINVDIYQAGDVDLKFQVDGSKGVTIDTVNVTGYNGTDTINFLSENFESYDVENPSDFSVGGTASGNWISSNTANDATRIFDTSNFGSSRLWISNVDGSSITSKGRYVGSHAHFSMSAVIVAETGGDVTITGEYDILVGQTEATATSVIGGPQSVDVRGDNTGVGTTNSKEDHVFNHHFQTSTVNSGDKVFLRFTRVSGGAWFGVDDVQLDLVGANTVPVVTDATFAVADNSAAGVAVGTVSSTDTDTNDSVSLAITAGNSGGHFTIDSGTGAITTTSTALDYQVATSHVLTVTATDLSGQSDTATITVNVYEDTDTDNQGDAWEIANFGDVTSSDGSGDADSDGQDDVSEFQAGTDPNNAADTLKITEVDTSVSDSTVKWEAKNGKTYTIKYSYDLTTWHDVMTGQNSTANGEMNIVDADPTRASAAKVFYRVVVE